MVLLCCLLLASGQACAERIKDLASIAGIRNNQLTGYGLVVGLDGSGDQTTQTPFTVQSIINMLGNMGISMPTGTSLQLKNVAAVMVTATLPPFARPGQAIDVTVSSIGNAKSLKGGTLVMTPLKGADNNVYAMAQGNVLVAGGGKGAQLSVGRITEGATVEKAVPTVLGQGEFVTFELNESDFGTAQRIVEAVNREVGGNAASALDSRQIRVRAPTDPERRVAFIARLQALDVNPAQGVAKVIVNARTGSVVMNQLVTIQNCAVAHGSLSVTVGGAPPAQPGMAPAPEAKQESLLNVKQGASLAEVVKALNAIGANPQDLIAILQAMKAAGALRAELEII